MSHNFAILERNNGVFASCMAEHMKQGYNGCP